MIVWDFLVTMQPRLCSLSVDLSGEILLVGMGGLPFRMFEWVAHHDRSPIPHEPTMLALGANG